MMRLNQFIHQRNILQFELTMQMKENLLSRMSSMHTVGIPLINLCIFCENLFLIRELLLLRIVSNK